MYGMVGVVRARVVALGRAALPAVVSWPRLVIFATVYLPATPPVRLVDVPEAWSINGRAVWRGHACDGVRAQSCIEERECV